MIRWAALAVVLLALGGCYTSEENLLDPAQAVRVLKTGKQVATRSRPEPRTEKVEIVVMPGGWYEVRAEKSAPSQVMFAAMPGQADRFFVSAGGEGFYLYGVATRANGKVSLNMADCEDEDVLAIAKRNGARVENTACHFTNRAGLTKALTEYAALGKPPTQESSLPALP